MNSKWFQYICTAYYRCIQSLRGCEKQISLQVKKCEDDAVDQLKGEINKFINVLAEVFPEDAINQFSYDIEDAFEDDIHNTLSQYVSENISTDSPEFVKILNMSDAIREEKTKEYTKKVINKALALLEEKCRDKKSLFLERCVMTLKAIFSTRKMLQKNLKRMSEKWKSIQMTWNTAENRQLIL